MKKLLLSLLLSCPLWATSTLTHSATSGNLSCSPACGAFALGFTAASGNVLHVIAFGTQNSFMNAGNSGFGTWVFPTNCRAFISGGGSVSCAYVILTSTTTSITMTSSVNGENYFLQVAELNFSLGTIVAQAVPAGTTSAGCSNNCTTATTTLSGSSSYALVAGMANGNTGCSVASPWTNFAAPTGDAWGLHLSTTSGTGATFTQGTSCPTAASGVAAMIVMAFGEGSGGGGATVIPRHRGRVVQ